MSATAKDWSTCKNCGRLIESLHWPTGDTNWCHVFDDGQPITVYCEFDSERRWDFGSTEAEPAEAGEDTGA